MKLNVGVIGVGNMGKNHVRAYSKINNVDLVAISDINSKLGKSISKDFNVKFYKDFKKMLTEEKLDIVSICVPTKYHYLVARETLTQKINTLLEKPITSEIGEAKELLVLSKKHNVKFLVGHIERFNPAVNKVKEIIDRGELGEIIAIEARRVGGFPPQIYDSDIAIDLSIHDIDIANYLLQSSPDKTVVVRHNTHITKREDAVEFFLFYKNASAYLQANWITPVKIRKLNITGKEGYLELDYISQKIDFYKSNYKKFKKKISDFSDYILEFSDPDKKEIFVEKREPLVEEINYFIKSVKNNSNINSRFALDALKIALKK